MSLSSLSKTIICMALALNLGACSGFLSSMPILAEKGDTRPFEQPLPINTQPKRLALGHSFAIGVKEDGTVWSWGRGSSSELGRGDYNEDAKEPRIIPNMSDFLEVTVGGRHVLALRKDGTVWSWGNNEKGQLGYKEDGHIEPNYYRAFQKVPKQIPDLKDVVSIAAGENESYALDKRGQLWGWGTGLYVFSQDEKFKQATPRLITQDESAVKVIGGGGGAYSYGILKKTGDVELRFAGKLLQPKFDAPVIDLAMIPGNSYFLLNTGRVYALGGNSTGELAQRGKAEFQTPLLIKNLNRIIKIDNFTALDDKGRVWQWGGIAGINIDKTFSGNNMYSQYFPRVMVSDKEIVDIYCCSFALSKDGAVWAWSNDTGGRRGDAKPVISSFQKQTHHHWTTPVRSLWTWK